MRRTTKKARTRTKRAESNIRLRLNIIHEGNDGVVMVMMGLMMMAMRIRRESTAVRQNMFFSEVMRKD